MEFILEIGGMEDNKDLPIDELKLVKPMADVSKKENELPQWLKEFIKTV